MKWTRGNISNHFCILKKEDIKEGEEKVMKLKAWFQVTENTNNKVAS